MKQPIMACAWIASATIALTTLAFAGNASAAAWRWGCMGPLGENEIISNRYQLLVIPGKIKHRKLYDLIFLDDLTKDENIPTDDSQVENYNADDGNSGLVKEMGFTKNDNPDRKLALTEKSSKTVSHRIVHGCRDEITDRFRKVYRIKLDNESPRDVTLECIDYMLTTRGGRTCN